MYKCCTEHELEGKPMVCWSLNHSKHCDR